MTQPMIAFGQHFSKQSFNTRHVVIQMFKQPFHIKRDRMVRNAAIAEGNSGDPALVEPIAALLDDEAPVVRGAAIWALSRLDPACFFTERARRETTEHDAEVRAEWSLSELLS